MTKTTFLCFGVFLFGAIVGIGSLFTYEPLSRYMARHLYDCAVWVASDYTIEGGSMHPVKEHAILSHYYGYCYGG
jgi:hypothetical protein